MPLLEAELEKWCGAGSLYGLTCGGKDRGRAKAQPNLALEVAMLLAPLLEGVRNEVKHPQQGYAWYIHIYTIDIHCRATMLQLKRM